MDLGLYQLKYPVRKLIGGVLPLMQNVRPDAVSWSILPVGIAAAACYFYSDRHPAMLIIGPVLILLRMFLATLDGLMAVTFGKTSARGEIANRVPGEISDALLILTIAQSPGRLTIGAAALAVCWITTFAGLIGLTAARPVQSVGPAGQTDRLAALIAFSLVGFIVRAMGHPLDVLLGFLWWVLIGGTITIVLRLWRTLRSCPS